MNSIEKMWLELKMSVMGPKPTNLTHIEASAKKVSANIPMKMYPKLGETY